MRPRERETEKSTHDDTRRSDKAEDNDHVDSLFRAGIRKARRR